MIATRVTPELLTSRPLPAPEAGWDKNSRGTVLIAGGSTTSAGGATLAAMAAFRAGAGKVKMAVPRSMAIAIAVAFPEAGVHGFTDTGDGDPVPDAAAADIAPLLEHVHAGLIGPGITNADAAVALAARLLEIVDGPSLVLDAMALGGLWQQRAATARHGERLMITPHAGEMAQMMGVPRDTIEREPQRIATEAAAHLGCVVVLKGPDTVIAAADGTLFLHQGGVPGLATSGSGDVLGGIIVALLARGASTLDAALWSVYVHARAGARLAERIGPLGFLARELPAEIPALMRLTP